MKEDNTLQVQVSPIDTPFPHNVLKDAKFTSEKSLGREIETRKLKQLDHWGKGWLNDFHTIFTSIPFRRLFLKPQVFRVNEGSVDTTTRGTHSLDVISLSQQLCKHLGLNCDYASAMAALHDVGHPPLGHIGEETLSELSGRKFKHNYFSLSLAEIFGMNLLIETLVGASLHKTHGGKFPLPNAPLEVIVLRIADKISYVPRDVFDGIRNGYLKKIDIPGRIFDVLGDTPEKWFETLIDTIVIESAAGMNINFSEKSGKVFESYKTCRKIVYKKLHDSIHWKRTKLNMGICYDYNKRVFSDIDPVVITAYMTDEEVNRLAKIIESAPVGHLFTEVELKNKGFGFLEIVNVIKMEKMAARHIYYNSLPGDLLLNWGIS